MSQALRARAPSGRHFQHEVENLPPHLLHRSLPIGDGSGVDIHVTAANQLPHASNKSPDEIPFRLPIGVLEPVFDASSEVLQACDEPERFTSLRGQFDWGLSAPSHGESEAGQPKNDRWAWTFPRELAASGGRNSQSP